MQILHVFVFISSSYSSLKLLFSPNIDSNSSAFFRSKMVLMYARLTGISHSSQGYK